MIEGPVLKKETIHICDGCVKYCYDTIQERQNASPAPEMKALEPQEIKEYLDQYIIGQDVAKKSISVAIYNHYKRLQAQQENDIEIQKDNILIIGPSGSGKTLLAKTVAKIMNLPFAIGDATTLTESGYMGNDVEHLIERLLQSAEGDVARAERGIIFIDEIDKKRKKTEGMATKDASGEGVQQALLKLVEGTTVKISSESGFGAVDVDTSNILFICGGSFIGLNDIVKQGTKGKSQMGFGADVKTNDECSALYKEASVDNLIDFGMIPEFIGRFTTRIGLDRLTEENMYSILTEPKNSLTEQYKELFKIDGVTLVFNDKYIKHVAHKGHQEKTGARGLKSIIQSDLSNIQYDLPQLAKDGIKYVYVLDNGKTKVTKKRLKQRKY
jgi:ATP-dependent Clp protease ATP-binding subunit ClpX